MKQYFLPLGAELLQIVSMEPNIVEINKLKQVVGVRKPKVSHYHAQN